MTTKRKLKNLKAKKKSSQSNRIVPTRNAPPKLFNFSIRWLFAFTAIMAVVTLGFSAHFAIGIALSVLTIPSFAAIYCYTQGGFSYGGSSKVCIAVSILTSISSALVAWSTSGQLWSPNFASLQFALVGGALFGALFWVFPFVVFSIAYELLGGPTKKFLNDDFHDD